MGVDVDIKAASGGLQDVDDDSSSSSSSSSNDTSQGQDSDTTDEDRNSEENNNDKGEDNGRDGDHGAQPNEDNDWWKWPWQPSKLSDYRVTILTMP